MNGKEQKEELVKYLTNTIEGMKKYRESIYKQIEAISSEQKKIKEGVKSLEFNIKKFEEILKWVQTL